MKASVIIPLYNAERHLDEQLLALARQRTDVAWELILADNGCTDDTLEIVARIAPQIGAPVRVIDASQTRGVAAARNAGAAAAQGEYLLFIDQDDVVDDGWLQEMVNAMREHPFVGGSYDLRTLNAERSEWRWPACQTELPTFARRPFVPSCNCGVAADVYAAVGGFSEGFVWGGEDLDLSLKLIAHGAEPVFAERAVLKKRYRSTPREMLSQSLAYGRGAGLIYRLHAIKPPTFLDLAMLCYRSLKSAIQMRSAGRRPVRPVNDAAFAIAEASIVWRQRAFWQPVYRNGRPENLWLVQVDRLRRLGRRVSRVTLRKPSGRADRP